MKNTKLTILSMLMFHTTSRLFMACTRRSELFLKKWTSLNGIVSNKIQNGLSNSTRRRLKVSNLKVLRQKIIKNFLEVWIQKSH